MDGSPFRIGAVNADLVLIDLDRLPSHGREVAVWLRGRKATRMIPIVFAGGVPDNAAGLSAGLVDYKICSVDDDWSGLKFTRRSAEKSPATS